MPLHEVRAPRSVLWQQPTRMPETLLRRRSAQQRVVACTSDSPAAVGASAVRTESLFLQLDLPVKGGSSAPQTRLQAARRHCSAKITTGAHEPEMALVNTYLHIFKYIKNLFETYLNVI
jgi:hypothetical protein